MISKEIVRDFFSDLRKKNDFDTSSSLLWGYYFLSSDINELNKIKAKLEEQGYNFVQIFEAEQENINDIEEHYLHLEKIEKHNEQSLIERNEYLTTLSKKFLNVTYDGFDVGK